MFLVNIFYFHKVFIHTIRGGRQIYPYEPGPPLLTRSSTWRAEIFDLPAPIYHPLILFSFVIEAADWHTPNPKQELSIWLGLQCTWWVRIILYASFHGLQEVKEDRDVWLMNFSWRRVAWRLGLQSFLLKTVKVINLVAAYLGETWILE
jgi:hypothetical protein